MSRSWTPEEIQSASAAMKAEGNMGYEEFCEEMKKVERTADCHKGKNALWRPRI